MFPFPLILSRTPAPPFPPPPPHGCSFGSRRRSKQKRASSDYLAQKTAGSVSGASGSADDEYYTNFNPIRTGGMLMPHGKAIAPASVKAVSPTPSQTQVSFGSVGWFGWWAGGCCHWLIGCTVGVGSPPPPLTAVCQSNVYRTIGGSQRLARFRLWVRFSGLTKWF